MNILFDHGTPVPLRRHLHPHRVDTVQERGWSTLSNGDLLKRAEQEGSDVFVTTDQNLRHQQNLSGRKMGIVVLMSASWPRIQTAVSAVVAAVSRAAGDAYQEISV